MLTHPAPGGGGGGPHLGSPLRLPARKRGLPRRPPRSAPLIQIRWTTRPRPTQIARLLLAATTLLLLLVALNLAAAVAPPPTRADGVAFQIGDVFAGVGTGQIKHYRPDGTLLDTLNTTSNSNEQTGMCFDVTGSLVATDFNARNLSKFNNLGTLVRYPFASGFNTHPESCVFDAAGNVYTGEVDAILGRPARLRKFDPSGTFLTSWTPAVENRGIDWIELAADQCTMFYTSEGQFIKRFNVCTGQQLAAFATIPGGAPGIVLYALRLRPNGELLAARSDSIYRLAADGTVLQVYPRDPQESALLFALNLDPDGQTFWTGGYSTGDIFRYDIASGTVLTRFTAPPNTLSMAGLAVYGEIQVAAPPTVGPTEPETRGGGSAHVRCPICELLHAVNTATGNFWRTFADLEVPGRGPGLAFSHTYNSLASGVGGPLGPGWTHLYNSWVDSDTLQYYVHEGNGSIVPFPKTGAPYPRVQATLVQTGTGFLLTEAQGQTRYLFQPINDPAVYKLTAITDRNNYPTTLAYTSTSGLLKTVTDPAGRSLTFAYTVTGTNPSLLTSVTDPAGRVVAFGYDASGNLQTATDVGGQPTAFSYDAAAHLQTVTDPRQGQAQTTYDAQGRALQVSDPLARTLHFQYTALDALHSQTVLVDALGYTTVYTYDANRLSALTRNPGPAQATWRYTYSPLYPVGVLTATDPLNHTWAKQWDSHGNLLSSTDPLTRTVGYAYNATNDLLVLTNSVQMPITYTYDLTGNLLTVSRPLTQTGQILTTTLGYDPGQPGDVLTVTNPLGNRWTYGHDPATGYVLTTTDPLTDVTRVQYDLLGRPLSLTTPRNYTATTTYNAYGDPLVRTDTRGYTTTTTYDANRNPLTVTDANQRPITTTYDLDNEALRVTHADGSHADTAYDGAGRVVSQTNELTQTTSYAYDWFNHLVQVTDPLTVTAVYTYDLAGNVTVLTDAQQLSTTFGYDPAYELSSVTYHDGGTTPNVSYAYSALGQRTSMTDGTGSSRYAYDSLNRLTSLTNGAGATVVYTYDVGSRLTGLRYPGVGDVSRGYDAANRLTSVTDWLNNTSQFGYDADGNLTALTYPQSKVLAGYSYDGADQLSGLAYTLTKSSTVLLAQTYTHDPVGVLSTTTESGLGTDTYGYDPRYRLTGDGLAGGTPSTRAWRYDGATEIVTTTTSLNGGTPVTTTRGYNAGNALLSLVQGQGGTTQQNLTLAYDPRGNRTTLTDAVSGQSTHYGYDQANRLRSVGVWNYAYNGDGLRMSKSGTQCCTHYTWDAAGGLPLLLADGTGSYIYGPGGLLLEQVQGSTAYDYVSDRQGSVRALLRADDGTTVATYQYDAYGQTTASTGSVTNPFRYTGQYQDSESGFYYLRARYYDPATQQFLTRDPLLAVTGQAYTYAGGSPVNGTDPSGLECDPAESGPTCFAQEVAGYEGAGTGTGGNYKVVNTERGPIFIYPGEPGYETGTLESSGFGGGGDFGSPGTAADQSECPLTAGEAGRFGDLDSRRVTGDDLTPHHMPQARQGFTSRNDGGSLMLPTDEHILTRTYGSNGRVTYRLENGMGFRSVLALDIFDILKNFGGKYNPGLRDLLNYYRTNFPNLVNK